jgi:hypothetical protein
MPRLKAFTVVPGSKSPVVPSPFKSIPPTNALNGGALEYEKLSPSWNWQDNPCDPRDIHDMGEGGCQRPAVAQPVIPIEAVPDVGPGVARKGPRAQYLKAVREALLSPQRQPLVGREARRSLANPLSATTWHNPVLGIAPKTDHSLGDH